MGWNSFSIFSKKEKLILKSIKLTIFSKYWNFQKLEIIWNCDIFQKLEFFEKTKLYVIQVKEIFWKTIFLETETSCKLIFWKPQFLEKWIFFGNQKSYTNQIFFF